MSPLLLIAFLPAFADPPAKPKEELLWPKGAPGAVGKLPQDKPTITAYLPAKDNRTGTAVVVCPGGGYGGLAIGHEGKEIAEWLNKRGICAFVVKYRLGPRYRHPAPLQDAQRAIRIVRSRAKDYGLDAKKIGIWGFSAGGHLASTAATKFDAGKKDDDDPIQKVSCRPDFAILAYPVIRMDKPHTHMGSRNNLLGPKPDEKLVKSLCNDTQVTKDTPPVFLFHTKEDRAVVVANSELFAAACKKAGVPYELIIRDKGPHGVGLAQKYPDLKDWPEKLEAWMKKQGVLKASKD